MSQQLMLELQEAIEAVFVRNGMYGKTMVRQVNMSTSPAATFLDTAQGDDLDAIAEQYGIKRFQTQNGFFGTENDDDLRKRIEYEKSLHRGALHYIPITVIVGKSHDGHEVVENTAGGNKFNYCRTCKCEVI